MVVEEFKKIPGFEKYWVSNLGTVISVKTSKRKILARAIDGNGYHVVTLHNNPIKRTMKVSTIVAMAFLGHKAENIHTTIVRLKDGDKLNPVLSNLEIVEKTKSKQPGVRYSVKTNKWRADINYMSVKIYVGSFNTEQEAINAYLDKLDKVKLRFKK